MNINFIWHAFWGVNGLLVYFCLLQNDHILFKIVKNEKMKIFKVKKKNVFTFFIFNQFDLDMVIMQWGLSWTLL